MAAFAIFVQALSPVKYVGWGIMGLYVLSTITLTTIGLEDNLYRIDGAPVVPLSDMNGQGQYWIGRLWFLGYWFIFAIILALLSHYLWRRGTEQRLRPRLRRLPARLAGAGGVALAVLLVSFAGVGGYIYYNTHILNEYRTARGNEKWLAEYERALLKYEHVPKPRITDVKLVVDLYPHALSAHVAGTYTMVNRTGQPLDRIHVRWWRDLHMDSLKLDGAKQETSGRLADNGTFLNNSMLAPQLGMDRGDLLTDRTKRRKYGLPPELRPAKLEDEAARGKNALRSDSDWVTADITLSTVADQIPMAPGTEVSDMTQNGRHIGHFVSDAPIANYFSIQSAAYKVA
jgi:ABC-2 type transport system permease protein